MKYWAFISYSHTDREWGDWLHKVLETYRVPRRLIGRESRDGTIPARLFPIFREKKYIKKNNLKWKNWKIKVYCPVKWEI